MVSKQEWMNLKSVQVHLLFPGWSNIPQKHSASVNNIALKFIVIRN